jgi:hypothetical protein
VIPLRYQNMHGSLKLHASLLIASAIVAFLIVVPNMLHAQTLTDLCNNLLGYQIAVPFGTIRDGAGNCVPGTTDSGDSGSGGGSSSGGADQMQKIQDMLKQFGQMGQTGSTVADAQCVPAKPVCGCRLIMEDGKCKSGENKFLCPCKDPRGVAGICTGDQKCKAVSYQGLGGGSQGIDQGMQALGQALGGIFQKLMGGQPGGGSSGGSSDGSGSGSGGGSGFGGSGCTHYYQVSTQTSDPCAYYVPPVSGGLGGIGSSSAGSDLLNSLFDTTGSQQNISNLLNGNGSGPNIADQIITGGNGGGNNSQGSGSGAQAVNTLLNPFNPSAVSTLPLQSGLSGNIFITGSGATFQVNSQDTNSNSAVAGFLGSDVTTGEPQGLVAGLCQSRPWTSNFLSVIVPASFFDGLCSWQGYQVGQPAPQPGIGGGSNPVLDQHPVISPHPRPGTGSGTTTPIIPPRVAIWAVPASVPLGARTSIFWTSQGVTGCMETSPDGSFSQNTLSGGASTVALAGITTFTISCISPDGSPVTDYVTVTISL